MERTKYIENDFEFSKATKISNTSIIAFEVDKNSAEKAVKKWIKKKYALISVDYKMGFKLSNIKGIYSPIWVYEADISCEYKGQGGKTYYENSNNGKGVERAWFYDANGKITATVRDIAVSDAVEHNHSISEVLPYNLNSITNMEEKYSNKFNITDYYNGAEKSFADAKIKMRKPIDDEIEKEIRKRYDKAYVKEADTKYLAVRYKEVLAPVWIGYCSYKGKKYYYIVNGQTGKVSGSYPVSAGKAWIICIAIIVVFIILIIYSVS